MNNVDVDALRSRWLGGQGTKVLYAAIGLIVWCAVGSGLTMAEANHRAQVSETRAVELAQITVDACHDPGFRAGHVAGCAQAENVAGVGVSVDVKDGQAAGR